MKEGIFTAAQRRSLERISGLYLNLLDTESDFTISDLFSIGLLLVAETHRSERNENMLLFYKKAYLALSNALKIKNAELFLLRLNGLSSQEPWNDFNDFKAVWYPKWFANQIYMRRKLFSFANEPEIANQPDFWGASCAEDSMKAVFISVRDSFKQIQTGVLALVFKTDAAIASLMGWNDTQKISFQELKSTFRFPQAPPV